MTRVVKSDELDRPDESLSEQMKKLQLSPHGEVRKHLTLSHVVHLLECFTLL